MTKTRLLRPRPADLVLLEGLGTRRTTHPGDYLFRQGDATYEFYVVLSGAVEIVVESDGHERLITRHGAGRFLGELNLLTGQRVFVSARVVEAGEVIAIPREGLRHIIATNTRLSDIILAAFLARRGLLLSGAAESIRLVVSRFSPEAVRIREYLSRDRIPYEWLEPDRDASVDSILREFAVVPETIAHGLVRTAPNFSAWTIARSARSPPELPVGKPR